MANDLTGPYDYFDPDTPTEQIPSPPLGDFTIPYSPQTALGNPLYAGTPVGQNAQAMPPPGMDPRSRGFLNLLLLLLGGGTALGVGQNLFGQPPQQTTTPQLSPQQMQMVGGAQGTYQNLLSLLQNPHLTPGMSQLAEQAFQPQLGSLYNQATEAGRRRGFHDAPGTSPPGGAILGPGLADLQGQMAQAKLNLYQNQIANMFRTAQGQGQIATALPTQQRTQFPRPTILDTLKGVSPIVGDLATVFGRANPAGSQGTGISSFLSGLNPMNWFGG